MLLWLHGRATITELENMTLDELDTHTRYLDAWVLATTEARS